MYTVPDVCYRCGGHSRRGDGRVAIWPRSSESERVPSQHSAPVLAPERRAAHAAPDLAASSTSFLCARRSSPMIMTVWMVIRANIGYNCMQYLLQFKHSSLNVSSISLGGTLEPKHACMDVHPTSNMYRRCVCVDAKRNLRHFVDKRAAWRSSVCSARARKGRLFSRALFCCSCSSSVERASENGRIAGSSSSRM